MPYHLLVAVQNTICFCVTLLCESLTRRISFDLATETITVFVGMRRPVIALYVRQTAPQVYSETQTHTPARDPDNNGLLDKVICHKLCKPLLPPDLPGLMEFWECSSPSEESDSLSGWHWFLCDTYLFVPSWKREILQVEMSLYTLFGGANFDDVMRESISSGKLCFLGFCGIKIKLLFRF